MKNITILMLGFLFFIPAISNATEVEVTIKGIRSKKGKIQIGIFKNQESFERETPFKTVVVEKKSLFKGTVVYKVNLPPGVYGFAILDDENNNKEMDKSWLGIPTEGFGFSNYEHSGIFKPIFEDFKFRVKNGINKVRMNLKYM